MINSDLHYTFNIGLSLKHNLNLIYACFAKMEFHFFNKTLWARDYFIRKRGTMTFGSLVACQIEAVSTDCKLGLTFRAY